MNIIGTQYTLQYKSLDIYIAGCSGNMGVHCTSCHNPESWNFHQGSIYDNEYFQKIKNKVKDFNIMIENIMIFGGEPNDQNKDELLHFLFDMKLLNKIIWLFTRYDISNVPTFEKELCDYIKCGEYIESLKAENNIQYNIKLATSNQNIYKKGTDY